MKYGAIIATLFLLLTPVAQAETYQVVIDGVQGWATSKEVAPYTFDMTVELENGTHLQFVNSEVTPAQVVLRRPSAEPDKELNTLLIRNPLTPEQEREVLINNGDQYDVLIWYRVPVGIDGHLMATDCSAEECMAGAPATCALYGGLKSLDYETGDHCRYECYDGSKSSINCVSVSASEGGHDLNNQQTGGNGN